MEVLSGMTLMEVARKAQQEYSSKIVAAKLDGEVHDLQNDISGVRDVTFIPLDSKTGWQVYRRSVLFLLITAVHELYPEAEVVTQFTANKGLFCEIRQPEGLGCDMRKVQEIEQKMRAIVAEKSSHSQRSAEPGCGGEAVRAVQTIRKGRTHQFSSTANSQPLSLWGILRLPLWPNAL